MSNDVARAKADAKSPPVCLGLKISTRIVNIPANSCQDANLAAAFDTDFDAGCLFGYTADPMVNTSRTRLG